MTELLCVKNVFEEQEFTTLTYKGRPAWVASEVGKILGYADNGARITSSIKGIWVEDFIENHDYITLRGEELVEFKQLLKASEAPTDSVGPYTSQVVLLFESGLNMVLAKTDKPAGKKFRRFIVDKVMPQIARDGAYLPNRDVVNGQLTIAVPPAINEMLQLRKLEYLAILLPQLQQSLTGDALLTFQLATAEAALGLNLNACKPLFKGYWRSPTEIAKEFKVTVNRVALVVSQLGIRAKDLPGSENEYCRCINGQTKNRKTGELTNKQVPCYLYNKKGIALIKEELTRQGFIKEETQLCLVTEPNTQIQ